MAAQIAVFDSSGEYSLCHHQDSACQLKIGVFWAGKTYAAPPKGKKADKRVKVDGVLKWALSDVEKDRAPLFYAVLAFVSSKANALLTLNT